MEPNLHAGKVGLFTSPGFFPAQLKLHSMDPLFLAWLLYLAAVVLAMVDVFVPSGGLLLVLSLLAALAAILFGFRSSHWLGMLMLTVVIASVPTFVFVAIKVWPHTPLGRLIILKPPVAEVATATAIEQDSLLHALVGHVLLAEAPFLPSGQLRVGYQRFNALAESGFIEAGSHVRVLAVRQRNLIVRATADPLTDVASLAGLSTVRPSSNVEGQERVGEDHYGASGGSLLDRPAEELGLDSLES